MTPDWTLDDHWAVSRDTYNWILQTPKGDRWRAVGYYRTPELLLKMKPLNEYAQTRVGV